MVFTQTKVSSCIHTTKDVVTQKEQLQEHARIQVSGCWQCPSLAQPSEGSRDQLCEMPSGQKHAQPRGRDER